MTKKISKLERVQRKYNTSLVVVCSSVGNPDMRQDPDSPISTEVLMPCDTFRTASKICRNYIDDWDLGGGNWAGGQVYHPTKGLIAYVSYNGRVWQSTDGNWHTGTPEITDLDTNNY